MITDREYLRELAALGREMAEAFGHLHTFGWRAEPTRNHTTKAVGTSEDQGKTLYGADARAALDPRQNRPAAAPAAQPQPAPAGPATPRADGSHVLRAGGPPVNVRGYQESHVGRVFGWPVHPADLAAMSNAVPGASVKVEYAYLKDAAGNPVPSDVMVSVKGPGYTADRYFRRGADGKLEAHNDLFVIKEPGELGHNPDLPSGTDMLAAQVAALRRAGVARIKTFAAGNPKDPESTLNGYYTWPRLGYDGEVPPKVWKAMPGAIRRLAKPAGDTGDVGGEVGSSVRRLCLDPAGRQWWRANGRSFDAVFDLSDGSESLRVLAAYIRERDAKKGAGGGPRPGTGAGPAPGQTPGAAGTGSFGEGPRRAGPAPLRDAEAGRLGGGVARRPDRPGRRPALARLHTFAWSDWKPAGDKMVSPGGRKLPRETWERLSGAAGAGKQSGGRGTPKPGEIRHVHPDALSVDPQRFQFKLKTDAKTGAGRELQSVQVYNPELAGVLAVWHDPADGKTYVVNGHHRLDLARRAGAKKVAVRYVHAKDAAEARAKGALINIAEGRGTAVDAAKFLRDTGTTVGDLAKAGVSLAGPTARDAVTLSNLDSGLFHRVALGVLDVPKALAVAGHLPDHADQRTLLGHVERQEQKTGREMAPAAVAEAAKEMAATPKATVSGPGGGLFGNDPEEESVFLQRAELKAHVRQALTQQARDFGLLGSKRRVGNTAGVGNVIDPAKNKAAAEEAKNLVADFDRKVNQSGAVSDAVNRWAARLANAHTEAERDRVRRGAAEEVRRVITGRGLVQMSEWVRELHPFWVETFAWQQGKRGGRYWLPEGKQDIPANRLYGKKADRAAAAEEGGAQRPQRAAAQAKGPKPGEAERVARAKFEVARDAHEEASRPGSGVPAEQVAWLRRRMEAARAEVERHAAAGSPAGRPAAGAAPQPAGQAGKILTRGDVDELHRRKSRWERMKAWVADKYKQLEDRYGTVGAPAVMAGVLAPFPGAAPVTIGTAEVVRAVGHALGLASGKKGKGEPPESERKEAPDSAGGGHNATTATAGGGRGSGGGGAMKKAEAHYPWGATADLDVLQEWDHGGQKYRRVRVAGVRFSREPGEKVRAAFERSVGKEKVEVYVPGDRYNSGMWVPVARPPEPPPPPEADVPTGKPSADTRSADDISPAEKKAWEQLARAEVGTPAYERAKAAVVRAKEAAKKGKDKAE